MKLQYALIIACAVGLTACNDSHDDYTTPPVDQPNQVPSSATASTQAYKDYVGSLAKSESALPLDVNNVRPPTSETEVAVAL